MALAAAGTFALASGGGGRPTRPVVVTRTAVSPGQRLHRGDVEVLDLDVPDELATALVDPGDGIDGAVALGPLDEGAPVLRASVARTGAGSDAPPAVHEVAFGVDRERALGGALQPGERIDLLATFGSGADAFTRVVARRAQVLHVEQTGRSGVGTTGRVLLTLALDDERQVVTATHAVAVADLTVVRSTAADADADDPVDEVVTPRAGTTPPAHRAEGR